MVSGSGRGKEDASGKVFLWCLGEIAGVGKTQLGISAPWHVWTPAQLSEIRRTDLWWSKQRCTKIFWNWTAICSCRFWKSRKSFQLGTESCGLAATAETLPGKVWQSQRFSGEFLDWKRLLFLLLVTDNIFMAITTIFFLVRQQIKKTNYKFWLLSSLVQQQQQTRTGHFLMDY